MDNRELFDSLSPEDREIYMKIQDRKKLTARRRKQQRLRRQLLVIGVLIAALVITIVAARAKINHRMAVERHVRELMIYGSEETDGDSPLVETARGELGNIGGDPYWKWYGFDYHVDWCAIFVSWVAEQNGYIDEGKVPKFCLVGDGVHFFQNNDRWLEGGETPKAGDIIFFDREQDGTYDHTGIVAGVFAGRVLTIEGNTGWRSAKDSGMTEPPDDNPDWLGSCRRKGYNLDDPDILGYGVVD